MVTRLLVILCAAIAAPVVVRAQVVYIPLFPLRIDSGSNSFFGSSVSGAGDVNNDGFDDFIVGSNSENFTGRARVFSGKTGEILYTFNGDSGGDSFGWSVSGAGDVNNDGFADLIVGAPFDDNAGMNSGSARVFSGSNGSILYTFNGDSSRDFFGSDVSGAGDVNNDGFDDLIAGAIGDDNNGNNSGSARVFSGASGAILYTFNGDSADDNFGNSVSGAGDVNKDGRADIVVGAPNSDNTGTATGIARIFSGATGAVLYNFNGDSAFDEFGFSVSGAGDVNNDSFDDVIVGAIRDDNTEADSGSARVFSGRTGSILYTFNGDSLGDFFGTSVGGAGDVNNDGFADMIIGATGDDNNGFDSGSARVHSGATGATLYTFNGRSMDDQFGISVSFAGDLNNDGFGDLVVGASKDSNNPFSSGGAHVIISVPVDTPPAPCLGDANGDRLVSFPDITEVLRRFGVPCP